MFDAAVARHEHSATCRKYCCRQCGSRGPRDEYESHGANCSPSKFLESRSKQGTGTYDDSQIAANTLQKFLETRKIEASNRACGDVDAEAVWMYVETAAPLVEQA